MPKVKDSAAKSSEKNKVKSAGGRNSRTKSLTRPTQSDQSKEGPSSESTSTSATDGDISRNLKVLALDTLEKDTMDASWYTALSGEFEKPYFSALKEYLRTEYRHHTIFPPMNDIYSWSRLTPLKDVRVVILGQDPYHDDGQAHGLSFSVRPPTRLPPSLRNIYKQMANDDSSFVIPSTGDLTPLARAGVLWLNACLTVRAHQANSHSKKGWEALTAAVLRTVLDAHESDGKGVVFMAWGMPAQKTCLKVGIDGEKHLVLKSAHPSPLSAHRGFLGNGHFKQANEWLEQKYGEEGTIDWKVICEDS